VGWKAVAAQDALESDELLRIMVRVKARLMESIRLRRANGVGDK
jgi:hypothetical protein